MNRLNKRKLDSLEEETSFSDTRKFFTSFFKSSLFTFIKENPECYQIKKTSQDKFEFLGYFYMLPQEIFIKILKLLTVEELSILALTNTKIRNYIIENFLISTSGYTYLIRASQVVDLLNHDEQSSILNLFSTIGLFIKRCTFLYPTDERICYLIYSFENNFGIPSLKTFCYFDFVNFKFIFKCYGRIINRFILGWGDSECENVFNTIKDVFKINIHLETILKSPIGSKQKQELLVRNFFRMICSNTNDSNNFKEKLHWLSTTLNSYSASEVSRILIIVFGPLVSINNFQFSLPYIGWWDLTDSSFIENGLEDIGLALNFFFKYNQYTVWAKEYVLQLLKSVISTPTSWTQANVSTLLFYCGQELTLNFLDDIYQEGYMSEVASYLCYLNIITHKFSQNLSYVSKLFEIMIEKHGEELIEEIAHSFSRIVYDIDPLNDDDEREILDVVEMIESHIELIKLLMLKVHQLKKYIS